MSWYCTQLWQLDGLWKLEAPQIQPLDLWQLDFGEELRHLEVSQLVETRELGQRRKPRNHVIDILGDLDDLCRGRRSGGERAASGHHSETQGVTLMIPFTNLLLATFFTTLTTPRPNLKERVRTEDPHEDDEEETTQKFGDVSQMVGEGEDGVWLLLQPLAYLLQAFLPLLEQGP